MIYQRNVCNNLSSYLDVLWYVDENNLEDENRKDIVMPSGHIHLVYNFSDSYHLKYNNEWLQMPNMTLAGQFKEAKHVKYGKSVRQFGIAVRPSAFMLLFKQASSLYTDAYVDSSSIKSMKLFNEMVLSTFEDPSDDIERSFQIIEAYIGNMVERDEQTDQLDEMIQYMEEHEGDVDIHQMAKIFGYSLSSLERNFKKFLGLTPKAYANIIRFRKSMMLDDPTVLFYDQSHYIKACKKYTDKSPTELAKATEITLMNMFEE